MNNRIIDYIKSNARNKIIFHREEIPGIVPVNIGQLLSESIFNFKETSKISMKVLIELDNIFHTCLIEHDLYGKFLSIANLGILFEPGLKLDFFRLLDSYSQNNVLFVQWDGEMDSENLYFLTKENGVKIHIKNISHIIL